MNEGVGILEYRDDAFICDLVKELSDLKPEFITLKDFPVADDAGYRVIVDRLSFHYKYMREYLKLAALGGCYVINNPFSSEVNNKLFEMKVCKDLGIPFPKTVMLPMMKEDDDAPEHIFGPDWGRISGEIRFPAVLKPHDGFGWENVYEVESVKEVEDIYDALKFSKIMMLQEKVKYTSYFRAYCIGKRDVMFVRYEPAPFCLGKYLHEGLEAIEGIKEKLTKWTIKLNERIDFDINSVEWCIDHAGNPFLIDAFNEVPDMEKKVFPREAYHWIIEHVAKLVREKHKTRERNKTP